MAEHDKSPARARRRAPGDSLRGVPPAADRSPSRASPARARVLAAVVVVALAVALGGGGSRTISSARRPRRPCAQRRCPRRPRAGRPRAAQPPRSTACRSPTGRTASAGAARDRAAIALTGARSRRSSTPTRAAGGSATRSSPARPRPGSAVACCLARRRVLPAAHRERRAVVTWLRDGHLCVVSGHGVSSATLLKLASWSDHDETLREARMMGGRTGTSRRHEGRDRRPLDLARSDIYLTFPLTS